MRRACTALVLGLSVSVAMLGAPHAANPALAQPAAFTSAPGTIETFAGGYTGDGGPATAAVTRSPMQIAVDASGDLYISSPLDCSIRRVSAGIITAIAGDGSCTSALQTGPGGNLDIGIPGAMIFDAKGNLVFGDGHHCSIRKMSAGVITTVAGNGTCGDTGDGGPATSAELEPGGLALDAAGNLYVTDSLHCVVREIDDGGTITTAAGSGACGYAGDRGPATAAKLSRDYAVAVDAGGNLFIGDRDTCRVREVSGGIITTVAGNGTCGFSGDGGPATAAAIHEVDGIAIDAAGDLLISDPLNCRIRQVHDGTITTIAGNGAPSGSGCAVGGDGGPATAAGISPTQIITDAVGDIYLAGDCRVREISGGTIATVAGNGTCRYAGDGGMATKAALYTPNGVLADASGNVYIADTQNCRIREVSGGTITTVAGSGCGAAPGGDGGPATSAGLPYPYALALDRAGDLYISSAEVDCTVRKVSAGIITTVAGNGVCAYAGDNGPATSASLYAPASIGLDAAGNLYIADMSACRVREVSGGVITTIAGMDCASGGDDQTPTTTNIGLPNTLTVSPEGDLYIGDLDNCVVRRLHAGALGLFAGSGGCNVTGDPRQGDGHAPTSAGLGQVSALALDAEGNLWLTDINHCIVRQISDGVIRTYAGNGLCGESGEGGPATSASIANPQGITLDGAGNLYVADQGNDSVHIVYDAKDGSGGGATDPPSVGGIAELPESSGGTASRSVSTADDGGGAAVRVSLLVVLFLAAIGGGAAALHHRRRERP